MRHPLIRILLALLIGVWSPLCCCRAMAAMGTGCGASHVGVASPDAASAVVLDACCQGHGEQRTPDGVGTVSDPSTDERRTSGDPRECPACPSCEGAASSAALNAEVKLPALVQQWDAVATIAAAVIFHLPEADDASIAGRPSWCSSPPYIKANRAAQLWHCALTI